jgi:hypothetical protein
MLTKQSLEKIDKFYFAFFAVMALLAVIVIYTFQTVFSAVMLSYDTEADTKTAELKINLEGLESVYGYIYNNDKE